MTSVTFINNFNFFSNNTFIFINVSKKNKVTASSILKGLRVLFQFLKVKLNSSVLFGLNNLYAVSYPTLSLILTKFGFSLKIKFVQLHRAFVKGLIFFFDLYFFTKNRCLKLFDSRLSRFQKLINYKGFRHIHGLPVNGQRTCSNSKSCRSIVFHKKILMIIEAFDLKNLH